MSAVRRAHTRIVATIGPASDDEDVIARMIEAGMDVARLNFAHGTREGHARTAERIRAAASRAGREVAILQDLPGPKLRIGPLREGVVELKPGDQVTLVCGSAADGDARRMTVAWDELPRAVGPNDVVYLADGTVRLRVISVRGDELETQVEIGGTVASRQGLNVPGELATLPSVPEEDLDLLRFGATIGVDLVALSFVRQARDVDDLRRHTDRPLIAKIEKPQAVKEIDAIAHVSDCVMVARGDLGIELRIEDVPLVQKKVIAVAGSLARPVVTATQMLDSMVTSSRPTRAEVTDVANAILDGSDALMLSEETAVGRYPIEAVQMMATIARRTEEDAPYEHWNETRVRRLSRKDQDPAYTVAYNACAAARQLDLAAIVVPTLSPDPETVRRCSLLWGVTAGPSARVEVTEDLIADAARRVVQFGWVKAGERIVITAGLPSGRPGTTSLLQVQAALG